jgi:hypothetical protein
MTDNHPDEDIELAALGMLEPDEQARIDAHVAVCDACAARLARAEAAVVTMLDATTPAAPLTPLVPQRAGRVLFGVPLGAAAAVAALLLLAAGLSFQQHTLKAVLADRASFDRDLVTGHFAHVPFAANADQSVAAKLIYDRRGRWYRIVALDPQPGWRAELDGDAVHARALTGLIANGEVTFRPQGVVREAEIIAADGTVVATARPVGVQR